MCKICSKKTLKKAWSSRADKQDLEGGSGLRLNPGTDLGRSSPVSPGDFSNGEKAPGMKCWVWSFLLNHCGTCQRGGILEIGLEGLLDFQTFDASVMTLNPICEV